MIESKKINLIGIMSVVHEGRRPFGMQTYFFEDMVKNIDIDAAQLFFFSPLDWKEGIDEIIGFKLIKNKWTEAKESIPKIIYDRAFSRDNNQKKEIEQFRLFLKESGKFILNPLALADLLNNKIKFHSFLEDHDIATLGTYPFSALKDDQFFNAVDNTRFYVKPTFGSKGEGIYVIEKKVDSFLLIDKEGNVTTFNSYAHLLESLLFNIESEDEYFVQVEAKTELYNDSPFDIRVLVQNYGDEYVVTGKAVRIGQKKSITSNLNSGGSAFPLEELADFFTEKYANSIEDLNPKIDKLCLDCSKAIKNEFGDFCEIGFDILVTKDKGPIILEGNAKPSRWVFVKIADYFQDIGKDNSYFLDRRNETVSVPMKYAKFILKSLEKTNHE